MSAPPRRRFARRREQTRARYPDAEGFAERDGVLFGRAATASSRVSPADLVDRPLAALEGADRLPGPPLGC